MSIYIVTGALGSGKSLLTISKVQEYVLEGRRVAGNFDLDLEALGGKRCKVNYCRVPDFPMASDLDLIGKGYDTTQFDEDKNGVLILDELAVWLNSRSWNDPERKNLIRWLVHARKLGWDVFLLCQHIDMIDSQIREALCEFVVTCHALDKVKIPIFSALYKLFTGRKKLPLPKLHIGAVKMGRVQNPISVDRWSTTGKRFYKCYDTAQIFSPTYENGTHTVLSPWHVTGRYLPAPLPKLELAWRIPLYLYLKFCASIFNLKFQKGRFV